MTKSDLVFLAGDTAFLLLVAGVLLSPVVVPAFLLGLILGTAL